MTKLLRQDLSSGKAQILDIGSGQGDFLFNLRRVLPEAHFVGLELSASGVECSRKKVPEANFIIADLFRPPPDLDAYVGWATEAVCSEVLEHVDSPTAFLRAARLYLADDARLIVTVPSGPMSAFDRHIGHRQHFTRGSISGILQEAGFAVERVYLSGFPFFNLYRSVVIARGKKLVSDVDAGQPGFSAWLANRVMMIFRGLFRLNLMDSRFGWQVVAVARKIGSD